MDSTSRKRRRSEGCPVSAKKSAVRRRKSLGIKGDLEVPKEKLVFQEMEGESKDTEEETSSMREEVDEEAGMGHQSDRDSEVATSDEEEQLEGEGGGAEFAAAAANNHKSSHSSLYKPPTRDELQTLKETQNLFKSNLMKLQITELLGEVKVKKTSSSAGLEAFLHTLRETLMAMPSTDLINLDDGVDELKKVKFPLSFTPKHSRGKFKFSPPSIVRVVGSYLLGTSIKSDQNVDLEICIPMDRFQVRDILNYRYFFKRALYLSHVACHLRKKKKKLGLDSIKFQHFHDNPLLPILVLALEEKKLSKYSICLHTSITDQSVFKISKLSPDRNNVRKNFLAAASTITPSGEAAAELGPATPHYNAHMLMEMGARERHMKEIYSASQDCPAILDAVILYKVWAKQRGLDKGYDGFTGFHFSLLAASLLWQKKISQMMSCYQIFRVLLQYISSSDWSTSGFLSSSSTSSTAPTRPTLDCFQAAYDVVFVDSAGFLNLCSNMSKEKYRWLQHEASLALKLLDDSSSLGFQALFMRSMPLEQSFDVLYSIPLSQLSLPLVTLDGSVRECMSLDCCGWPLPSLLSRILSVLRCGLKDRVKLMVPFLHTPKCSWLTTKEVPSSSKGRVVIGLLLDTSHAFSILTMGPEADQKEKVAEFRSFWGDKSEMRRFQDGSIKEAVVWRDGGRDGVEGKRDICQHIISHLLKTHFCINMEEPSKSNMLDFLLHCSDRHSAGKHDGEELMQKVGDAFTELSRDLRGLRDIPLSVTSLQGTSPTFRCTEVFPFPAWNGRLSSALRATPTDDHYQSVCYYPSCEVATPPFVPVHPVICQLESSGKWPEDIEAIRMVKVAFYIHIAKALTEGNTKILASPTKEYLDVLKDGHVFRVKLYHHHELVLLREKSAKCASAAASVALSSAMTTQLKVEVRDLHRSMVSLPVITSTLNGLQQRFPMFGRGARLCKRWLSAHLLSNHLSEEAVDLMVAHLFVHPAPFFPPSSDLVTFVRFLSLLSTHDWQQEPLIINFNDELSESKVSEINVGFSKNRSSLPPVVIFTPRETSWSLWTSSTAPSPPVLDRLVRLARATLSELSSMMLSGQMYGEEDVKRLFRSPLEDYNVLIHLHKRYLPCSHQAVDAVTTDSAHKAPNYITTPTHLPVIDFDPVQLYLKELEAAYSDFALFFYDKYGGSFIACVWKPSALIPTTFKISKAGGRVPVVSETGVKGHRIGEGMVLDVDAIVNDFRLLGDGLVKSVQLLN